METTQATETHRCGQPCQATVDLVDRAVNELSDLLTDFNRSYGTTIVMVLHDLNLAARYADHLIALVDGRMYACGDPADVLEPGLVKDVFGISSTIITDPVSGKPLMIPIGRHHSENDVAGRASHAE